MSTHFSLWSRVLAGFAILGLLFLIYNNQQDSSPLEEVQVKHNEIHQRSNDEGVRVLCYGDSLTAGMAPPSRELCPYATSLQAELTATQPDNTSTYKVDHIGLPGWTTQRFLDKADDERIGLRHDLSSHNHTDVVILMGGTNDLRMLPH